MDSQDSQIELNLDTTRAPKVRRNTNDQRRKEPEKKSPWKQEKAEGFRFTKDTDGDERGAFVAGQRSHQGHKGGSRGQREGRSAPGNSSVISSMFKNNPKIPKVHLDDVTSGREEVFSSNKFSELPLHPHMIANLESHMQIDQMTSVQQQAIPVILRGQDALVKSQTGTGKTLAYAVPIIQKLQGQKRKVQRSDGPFALVLVPTRELVLQTLEVIQKLLKPFQWIVPGCVMGGERKKSEKARLRRGISVLVATPGRIMDHIENTECLSLRNIKWLVLDEADRLLDMGFDKEIAVILNALNAQAADRQTVLLSATLTDNIERLASIALKNPKLIDIAQDNSETGTTAGAVSEKRIPGEKQNTSSASVDAGERTRNTDDSNGIAATENTGVSLSSSGEMTQGDFTIPDGLQQHFVIVPSKLRLVTLAAFILWRCSGSGSGKMLVFMSSRDAVEFHYALINHCIRLSSYQDTLQLYRLHGSMQQEDRTDVFQKFSEAKSGVLICTDVAARGLDLPKVRWIVQYNIPGQPSDYVHRVGRTARIGKKGHALLFLTPVEVEYVHVLSALKISLTEVPLDDIWSTLLSSSVPTILAEQSRRRNPNTIQDAAIAFQHSCENFVVEKKDNMELAQKAYQSFIRSYAAYPSSLKHIFHVKKLHLGHVAKSFALRETPSDIGGLVGNLVAKGRKGVKRKRTGDGTTRTKQTRKTRALSEFSSGLDSGILVAKKKSKILPSSVGRKTRRKMVKK